MNLDRALFIFKLRCCGLLLLAAALADLFGVPPGGLLP